MFFVLRRCNNNIILQIYNVYNAIVIVMVNYIVYNAITVAQALQEFRWFT